MIRPGCSDRIRADELADESGPVLERARRICPVAYRAASSSLSR